MADKKKKPTFISPAGLALFAWIRQPDEKYAKDGVAKYKLTLALKPDDHSVQEFKAQIDGWLEKVGGDVAPYEEKDGQLHVKFKSIYPPGVFDAHRNVVPEDVDVRRGSIVKAAFTANHFDTKVAGNGINLYLQAVQVIQLAQYSGPTAESLGFGEEEGFAPEGVDKDFIDEACKQFDKVEEEDDPPPPDSNTMSDDDECLPF